MTSTPLDPDLPQSSAFEAAYNLPEDFPEDLRALHAELIANMRNEARAVSMNYVQMMLIERIAYFYVAMKYRELSPEARLSLKETKELNDFWLKMTTEFNKILASAESQSRIALLMSIQDILSSSLAKVDDPEVRKALSSYWSEKFEELNV